MSFEVTPEGGQVPHQMKSHQSLLWSRGKTENVLMDQFGTVLSWTETGLQKTLWNAGKGSCQEPQLFALLFTFSFFHLVCLPHSPEYHIEDEAIFSYRKPLLATVYLNFQLPLVICPSAAVTSEKPYLRFHFLIQCPTCQPGKKGAEAAHRPPFCKCF